MTFLSIFIYVDNLNKNYNIIKLLKKKLKKLSFNIKKQL